MGDRELAGARLCPSLALETSKTLVSPSSHETVCLDFPQTE